MSREILALVLGSGAAVYIGGLYFWSEDENREQFQIFGILLAVAGAACLAVGVFEGNALFGAVAGLSGAGAVFVGKLLASERPRVYQGMVAMLGVFFLASLGFGFGAVLDLGSIGRDSNGQATTAASLPAQAILRGSHVRGVVSDSKGQPVAKAEVSLRGPLILTTPSLITRTTDDKGAYDFETSLRGVYELKVVIDGFETLSKAIGVEADDLDVGVLTLAPKPSQEITTEVLGMREEATATATPAASPTTVPTPPPSPTASMPVVSVTCTATPAPRLTRSPTRVSSATTTRAIGAGAVPTATPRPQGAAGLPPSVRPPATSTWTATPTRTATRTPTRTPTAAAPRTCT